MRGSLRIVLASVLAFSLAAPAVAAELKVLSAGAVQPALTPLVADYETATHGAVQVVFGNVGMIEDMLKRGEPADIVILTASALDMQVKRGGAIAATTASLGRVGMGLAVSRSVPPPNISSPAAFRAALLEASSIAYSDPASGGSSGIFFDQLIQRLGIADAIRQKAVLIRGGSAADQVASGRVAMAVQNISELIGVAGVRVVGPFPEIYQNYLPYSAAVAAGSKQPQPARAFIAYLIRPEAAARWRAAGFETAAPR